MTLWALPPGLGIGQCYTKETHAKDQIAAFVTGEPAAASLTLTYHVSLFLRDRFSRKSHRLPIRITVCRPLTM